MLEKDNFAKHFPVIKLSCYTIHSNAYNLIFFYILWCLSNYTKPLNNHTKILTVAGV